MQIVKVEKKKLKFKIGMAGPAGSGKTYSALKLAGGVAKWDKICVIDTENRSSSFYEKFGDYNTIDLRAPFTPEKYIQAIDLCVKSGMEVIIIDSISHEWDGDGGLLDVHSKMIGNSFTNWSKITPRHNKFIQAILQADAHVITTVRKKQDYVMDNGGTDGKSRVTKVGLKEVQRDGFEYELSVNFELDMSNQAIAGKDRTGMFVGRPEFKITEETGKELLAWSQSGAEPDSVEAFDSSEAVEKTEEKTAPSTAAKSQPSVEKVCDFMRTFTDSEKLLEFKNKKLLPSLKKYSSTDQTKLIDCYKGLQMGLDSNPSNHPDEFMDDPEILEAKEEAEKPKKATATKETKLFKDFQKEFKGYAKLLKWTPDKAKEEFDKIVLNRTPEEIGEDMLVKYVQAIKKRITERKEIQKKTKQG